MFLENRIRKERMIVWQKHYKEQTEQEASINFQANAAIRGGQVVTNGWAYNEEKGKLYKTG